MSKLGIYVQDTGSSVVGADDVRGPASNGRPPILDTVEGLTSDQVRERFAVSGPNDPSSARRASALAQILLLFLNPLVIILLIAGIISAFMGEVLNASIIITMVLLSVVINLFQTYRSQQAAERLREQVAPTATAMRDGAWIEVPRREIVPGDLIRLSAGDLVPADAILIHSKDLHVNQAALTGESLPTDKKATDMKLPAHISPEALNLVFLGTSVISGNATARVVATGPATAFGDIALRLAAKPPETEFERGTRLFGFLIMRTVFFLVLFVVVVGIALHRDAFQSLLFAVSLAVGLTPEFLPMITTVTLGKGAIIMSKHKVIVKHLEAIQNFGSMDILCSDKTGTLTTGNAELNGHLDPFGNPSETVLELVYINSLYQTGVKNPLDVAVLRHRKPEVEDWLQVDEIPFDFERRRVSVVVRRDGRRLLITKGAPESVLPLCASYEANEGISPLEPTELARAEAAYRELSAEGYRILAVAYREVPEQATYDIGEEAGLTIAGFATFSDPPREDALEVLEALHRDGVEVKILTGDNELVTRHICSQVGLDPAGIVLGESLNSIDDEELDHIAEKVSVFARLSPSQKNRIILALKRRSHVVGFLGDGINDAPSLHAADVGISVSTAVDVAKDAAEIILLERSLQVLHDGVIEGRKAFGNVMKYLLMGTSSNFGNMFSMAGATLFLPFLPMLPTQILLNNFMYDMAQITIPTDNVDATYIHKPRRWDIKLIRDFMIFIGPVSSIYDFLTFFVMLKVFHASEALFHTGWFVESLATQTLVLFVIRTVGNPFKSRPSIPLAVTTVVIVLIGALLPFSPAALALGFTPLPTTYFVFLIIMTITYLGLVELVKRWLLRRISI